MFLHKLKLTVNLQFFNNPFKLEVRIEMQLNKSNTRQVFPNLKNFNTFRYVSSCIGKQIKFWKK